ncbi:WD40-repeat-containing domain protein, partial [Diplogelasinospora grovesii]
RASLDTAKATSGRVITAAYNREPIFRFATSSSDGSVRVWNFAYFSIIYRLSSENLVTRLTFSPDSGRFYDLRGGSINAWESNSLTRFLESEENISDTNSEDQSFTAVSRHSESRVEHFESVATTAPAPNGSHYCVGYEDGTVVLFQKGKTEGVGFAQFYNFLDVTHTKWSADGNYVAVADLAGDIQVKRLCRNDHTATEIASQPTPQVDIEDGNIEEIIFSLDYALLFVSTRRKLLVFSVKDGTVQSSSDAEPGSHRRWLSHPTKQNVILAFGPADVLAYTWNGLEKISSSFYYELQQPGLGIPTPCDAAQAPATVLAQLSVTADYHSESTVTNVIATQDDKHVLLNVKTVSHDSGASQQILVFPIAGLEIGGS